MCVAGLRAGSEWKWNGSAVGADLCGLSGGGEGA